MIKAFWFARCCIPASAAAGLLSACLGTQPALPSANLSLVEATRPAHFRSWTSPAAKTGTLLYISTYSFAYGSTVYVFSYPSLSLVGELSQGALGMCSDKNGDVYMATYGNSVVEHAHGGTTPIKTLQDPMGLSYGCSVSPRNGDLAVTNYINYDTHTFTPGDLLIYRNATGTPTTYSGNFQEYYFCAYDDMGRLYVDGENNMKFALGAMSAKGSWKYLTPNVALGLPGNLQWHKSSLIVGDQADEDGYQALHEFSISGTTATQIGVTPLTGAGDVPQAWVEGRNVIAPDTRNLNVSYYPYPAGGDATQSYDFGTDRNGFGAAVSVAPAANRRRSNRWERSAP